MARFAQAFTLPMLRVAVVPALGASCADASPRASAGSGAVALVRAVVIALSDSRLDRKIREIVDDLRRALQELVVVSRQIRAYRDALARIGGQAQELVLADRHRLE